MTRSAAPWHRGWRLLVTRPQPQADEWVVRLQALGIDALALPLQALVPLVDPAPLVQSWSELQTAAAPGLVVFVSPGAVNHFFASAPAAACWPSQVFAAVTGPGSSAALRAAGVPPACIMEPPPDSAQFDSEALWNGMAGRNWQGLDAWVVRGDGGRDWLAARLQCAGARVKFVQAYARVLPQWTWQQRQQAETAHAQPQSQSWLFSSSQALANLMQLLPGREWTQSLAWATHPRIAQAARQAGFGTVHSVAPRPEAVASALTRSIQSGAP